MDQRIGKQRAVPSCRFSNVSTNIEDNGRRLSNESLSDEERISALSLSAPPRMRKELVHRSSKRPCHQVPGKRFPAILRSTL
jgi:hypothetical protein